MNNLRFLLGKLKEKKDGFTGEYFIPESWNYMNYEKYGRSEARKGEISVNPYEFYGFCIEKGILPYAEAGTDYLPPLGLKDPSSDFPHEKCVIYSMFPRMFTSWCHGREGKLFPGTLLKAICLLPYLKRLNINTIYLLPFFENSDRYKKGEISSPYAIKNIYKIDGILHDPLLGEYSDSILETEFKAFVEACHILGMKVMADFVFRTVSRDNDLIVEHPDWFYWIDIKHLKTFSAPAVDKVKKPLFMNDKTLSYIYRADGFKSYLAQFTYSPDKIDSEKWKKIVLRHRQTGENILDLVESEFGITTAPGFSDVVNDRQPPWTDVTYLRFYFDVHDKARKYISGEHPPYISQDGVSLSIYRGREENKDLRDYVSNVIPYYQTKFGIDGARIDMGHALSPDLNREIISKARSLNGNFILWSEEFNIDRSGAVKKFGYDFITGYTWSVYRKLEKPSFNKKLFSEILLKAEVPVIAALETPDTPRAALVFGDKRKLKLLVLLNCFLPNAIPFINNGMEIMEIQPMNLGLDNSEEGRYVLESDDPMYGKLAFFDNYCLHWKNGNREWMQNLLSQALKIRKDFIDVLSDKNNFIGQLKLKNKKIIFLLYFNEKLKKGIFFLANKNFESRARINFHRLFPWRFIKSDTKMELVYADDHDRGLYLVLNRRGFLEPGEVVIGSLSQ